MTKEEGVVGAVGAGTLLMLWFIWTVINKKTRTISAKKDRKESLTQLYKCYTPEEPKLI